MFAECGKEVPRRLRPMFIISNVTYGVLSRVYCVENCVYTNQLGASAAQVRRVGSCELRERTLPIYLTLTDVDLKLIDYDQSMTRISSRHNSPVTSVPCASRIHEPSHSNSLHTLVQSLDSHSSLSHSIHAHTWPRRRAAGVVESPAQRGLPDLERESVLLL